MISESEGHVLELAPEAPVAPFETVYPLKHLVIFRIFQPHLCLRTNPSIQSNRAVFQVSPSGSSSLVLRDDSGGALFAMPKGAKK